MPPLLNLAQPGSGPIIRPLLPPFHPELPVPANGSIQIQLVRRPRTFNPKTLYRLYPPQIVDSGVTPLAPPITVSLAPPPQRRRLRTPCLRAPQVVNQPTFPPVVTNLRVTLARTPQPGRGQGYGLGSPQTVNDPPSRPLDVTLAKQTRRPSAKSRLGQPQTVAQTATVVAPPVKVTFARPRHRRRQRTITLLGAPTLVDAVPAGPPSLDQQKLRIRLVAVPRAATVRAHWTLRRPTVVCICPILTPTVPGSLVLDPVATGTLTLTAQTAGTLTLTAASPGGLTLTPQTPGVLTLDPAPDDCC